MREMIDTNSVTKERMIRQVRPEYTKNQTVRLQWDWPRDYSYSNCVIFEVPENMALTGVTLEMLLAGDFFHGAVDRAAPVPFERKLTGKGNRYYIYPCRYDGDTRLILNQADENRSPVCRAKTHVQVKVLYDQEKKGLFGLGKAERQNAKISLSCDSEEPEGYIAYRISGGDRGDIMYGIDLSRFGNGRLVINLNMREKIDFKKQPAQTEEMIEINVTER